MQRIGVPDGLGCVAGVLLTLAALLAARDAPRQQQAARSLAAGGRAFLLLLAVVAAVRATLRHALLASDPVHPFGAAYRDLFAGARLGRNPAVWVLHVWVWYVTCARMGLQVP